MPTIKKLHTPLNREMALDLRIGDQVLLSGCILAARDAAHKRMVETLDRGQALPVNLYNQIIYYVGPSPAKAGQAIGAAGPTTAGRMDIYTPQLLAQGLLGMIGKGNRSKLVFDAMQKHGAVYFAALGGAGALLSKKIKKYTVLAYPDLGTEALAELEVDDFPILVVGDSLGQDFYSKVLLH